MANGIDLYEIAQIVLGGCIVWGIMSVKAELTRINTKLSYLEASDKDKENRLRVVEKGQIRHG